jgi:uncharacterized membrane protein YfcA
VADRFTVGVSRGPCARQEVAVDCCLLAIDFVPRSISSPWVFLLVGSLSAILAGAGKAGFGAGIGVAAVPILVYACEGNSELALGIMLPLLIACDYVSVIYWWRKWDAWNLRYLVPGAVVGIGLGTLALWWLLSLGGPDGHGKGPQQTTTNAALSLIIGLICLLFIVLQAIRAKRGKLIAFRPLLWQGLSVGAAAGLTSTLTHAAGPITGMYLLPQQMPKARFVATTNLYYWIGNQAKLPTYLALGLTNPQTLAYSLVLVPAVVAGALAGLYLHHRVNDKWFTLTVYALLSVAGANMVYKSILTLIGR